MPDSPTPWELLRRLERQEQACEDRARGHVDTQLHTEQVGQLRDELSGVGRRVTQAEKAMTAKIADLEAKQEAARREAAATRRWAITTLVTIAVAVLATVTAVLT